MKKESITHNDMINAKEVDTRKLPFFPIVHGMVWEHPDNVSCALLLYLPLEKKLAERILKLLRED